MLMHKRIKINIILVITVVIMLVLYSFVLNGNYSYASTRNIKKTCSCFDMFLAYQFDSRLNYFGDKITFNFREKTDRVKALRFALYEDSKLPLFDGSYEAKLYGKAYGLNCIRITKKNRLKVNELSKKLFGKSTSSICKVIVGEPQPWPILYGFDISLEEQKVIVRAKMGLENYDWDENHYTSEHYDDKVTFILKKTKKGKYGYIVKRIKLVKKDDVKYF